MFGVLLAHAARRAPFFVAMPWDIKRDGRCTASKPFGVVKRSDSELEGCHASHEAAERQLAALNAAERKDMGGETEVEITAGNDDQEEKAHLIGMEGRMVPISVTSFEDLDAMVLAEEMTGEMKGLTHSFAEMAENIFLNDEIENKAAALESLAAEFTERVGDASTKEKNGDHTKEQLHYKAVESDDDLAKDSDFEGGCSVCGFGESVVMKGLEKCPFCLNPLMEVA